MTIRGHQPIAAPSRWMQLAETRALWEAGASIALWPWLQLAPRGDGHAVLVLPGLLTSDLSTLLLRRYLRGLGHDVHGWGLGRNLGPRPGVEEGMAGALQRLHRDSGRRVSLVGWSLGGAYARLLAARHRDLVRCVVTLGSPFAGGARATNAWRLYESVSGQKAEDPRLLQYVQPTPGVPTSSIFSRSDAVVAWRGSLERDGPQAENIEVIASHAGLVAHPAVLLAVADRLAQPEGRWKPFRGAGMGPMVYPDPGRRSRA